MLAAEEFKPDCHHSIYSFDGGRYDEKRQDYSKYSSGDTPCDIGDLVQPDDPGENVEKHGHGAEQQERNRRHHWKTYISEQRIHTYPREEGEIDRRTPGTHGKRSAEKCERTVGNLMAYRLEKAIQEIAGSNIE